MAEIKNYNSCPLKKRPVLFVKEEEEYVSEPLPEQDEPVNLCVKKVVIKEEHYLPVNYTKSMSRPIPLKDITANNHQERLAMRTSTSIKEEDSYMHRVLNVPSEALYNLLPGYAAANHPHHSTATESSMVKKEPYWSYSREPSISPPSHSHLYGQVKMIHPPSPTPEYSTECYYHTHENVHKSESGYTTKQHRYMPYHLSRQHHIVNQYQTTMSPTHSHSSLNSLGSPRNSMSPASTSSSLPEDPYHMVPIGKSHVYESPASVVGDMHSSGSATGSTATINGMKNEIPRYQCDDCAKSYSTVSGLNKHKQFHCTASGNSQAKKSFECSFCPKTYNSLGALKMHIRTHTKPCKCHLCGKAFSRPWLLNGHIRTHTGDKPFSCQFCHRAFADKSNLRAHLQTHSDVKKYSCTSCSKTFSRMSLLVKHSDGGCPGAHDHIHLSNNSN